MQTLTTDELQGILVYYTELLDRYQRILAGTPQDDPMWSDHLQQYHAIYRKWESIPRLP